MRAKKAEITRAYEAEKDRIQGQMETLEQVLLGSLHRGKVKSIACEAGTVYTETVMQVSCSDWPAYHAWLIEKGELDGLEKRVGRKFVEAYAADNDGELPPGIEARREQVVRIRVGNT